MAVINLNVSTLSQTNPTKMMETILVTGANGQIGSELVSALSEKYERVLATDIRQPEKLPNKARFLQLNVLDKSALLQTLIEEKVSQVYHLAALLSATGESHPELAWKVNMEGLLNVLDSCVHAGVKKVFFPSTIAVFGPSTPRNPAPQTGPMEPVTVYGISKLAGERWCEWYFRNKGLDVRSIRYPGLISYKTKAGGGTTDYAVDIFFEAVEKGKYNCFLGPETRLPMMYMPDAIKGTIQLMEAPASQLSTRSAYNFAAFSFTPAELAQKIANHLPGFEISYTPDFRQQIADNWPQSIDDQLAKNDWHWTPEYDLDAMCIDMLENIRKQA
jgi:nucleoside-diphosphate-sugar epimerase